VWRRELTRARLVWWQDGTFHRPQGFYMAIYAALGVSQAIAFFVMGTIFAFFTYSASRNLHHVRSFRQFTQVHR
jgi:hypothetical protein